MVQHYIYLLIFIGLFSASKAQDFKVISGPMLGHFTNTSQHFWMMLQSSERKSQEQSLPNFNSYLNNYFKEKGQSIQTITDCRYLNKGRVIVSGILNCQKQSIAKYYYFFLVSLSELVGEMIVSKRRHQFRLPAY